MTTRTEGRQPGVALVTGISGQDGSYLAEALAQRGWSVHGLVRPGHEWGRAGINVHFADLADAGRLEAIVQEIVPDVIYNLGGISSVGYSWSEPYTTAVVTGAAPIALMDQALRTQRATGREIRFFQASSAEIFGAAKAPQSEATPFRPVTPYGVAKAMAHSAVGTFRSQGLAASSAILFNHESVLRPPNFVTRKITLGAAAISIGLRETLTLGNLNALRDFGWAQDYVEAMIAIAEAPEPDDFVVATGISHSIRDFAEAAFTAAGLDRVDNYLRTDPRFVRAAEAPTMRGDPSKIARVLGWKASTKFEEVAARMVEHDIEWLKTHGTEGLDL
ncbi:GDP-mannose 4,6-dehydratase [Sinomonas cellulolyticus]|uniref:GDP-mannose 4,6-dehydratase n=1 Tax=Sinomonas cellulolyticus TaxID=2801916 RepID=A0ABS1K4I5_9MICC|nr:MULTISPECIES: GDP-mannose 4,6-dehydratase [Sinomonas]MBL0706596.1 GDP-mannose 4,6-dehydratase [Sinomonas cellulolyticus]